MTDAALAGVIFVAPLVLGGRHDLGRFVFVAFTALAAIAWFARQAVAGQGRWLRSPVHLLALATGGLLVLQLLPLSPQWIERLSPRTASLLPLWTGAVEPGEMGEWATLSLTPEATRLSLAMVTAYALLFITVSHRIANHEDVARLLRWVGLSACVMAGLGLLQAAAPNGRFLWIYEHPSETTYDRLSGPFANRNHFAHFLVLGIAPLAASMLLNNRGKSAPHARTSWRDKSVSAATTLSSWSANKGTAGPAALVAIVFLAVILTASRGGAIALATAVAVFGLMLQRAGRLSGRQLGAWAGAAAVLLLAVSLSGYEHIIERIGALASANIDDIDQQGGRRKIWAANVAAIKSGGVFGAGAGSHRDIYPLYLGDPPIKEYTHADNSYLQIVTENGWAGAALLAAGLAMCGCWIRRAKAAADSPQAATFVAACVASIAASAVHAAFDFVWYLPSCFSITLVLLACLWRLGALRGAAAFPVRSFSFARAGACNVAVVVALLSVFAASEWFGPAMASLHWDAYHRAAKAQQELASDWLALPPEAAAVAREESHAASVAALEMMVQELERAIAWRPSFAAAHRQLANGYSELYHLQAEHSDNPMPAPQLREAAIASQFRSAAELDAWLAAAIGPNRALLQRSLDHAMIAARLAPLQGSPYVRLAAAAFLRGQGHAATDAYLRQALEVRPYDGDLLFEVGGELCVRGSLEAGVECWARALNLRGEHRLKVARAVAGNLTFGDLAERFQPEWDTLPEFWNVYRRGDEHNIAAFLTYAQAQTLRETAAAKAAGKPERVASLWRRLAQVQWEASQVDAAVLSLHHSRDAWPDDYATRRMLGFVLHHAGRPEQAAAQLQWCLDRRSDDVQVAQALAQISRDRMAARSEQITKQK